MRQWSPDGRKWSRLKWPDCASSISAASSRTSHEAGAQFRSWCTILWVSQKICRGNDPHSCEQQLTDLIATSVWLKSLCACSVPEVLAHLPKLKRLELGRWMQFAIKPQTIDKLPPSLERLSAFDDCRISNLSHLTRLTSLTWHQQTPFPEHHIPGHQAPWVRLASLGVKKRSKSKSAVGML